MSCTWIIILVREEDAWSGAAALHHAFVVSLCENHQDGIKSMPRRGDIKKNGSWGEYLEVGVLFLSLSPQ